MKRKIRNPKTDTRTSAVVFGRVPLSIEARLDKAAEATGISRSQLVAKFVAEGLHQLETQIAGMTK
jgi:hypothetical protein